MDPKAIISSYVDDVVRRLPSRQRKDVGMELRALLEDELAGKEDAEGRPADEAMTLALLRNFGAPDAAADRYRETGPVIIRGSDARVFTLFALGGVAIQWPITFLQMVVLNPQGELLNRIGHWWVIGGLGAFWWPGFMVTVAIVAAYVNDRFPRTAPGDAGVLAAWDPMKPAPIDPDRINRPLWAATFALFVAGFAVLMATPSLIFNMPEPVRGAFMLDQGFLTQRAPWIVPVWAAQIVVVGMVLFDGRWRRLTRRLDLAFKAAGALMLVWFLFAGPILASAETNQFAKLILGVLSPIVIIDLLIKARREFIRVPEQNKPVG